MSVLSFKSKRRQGQEGTALELGAWRVRAGGLPVTCELVGPPGPLYPHRESPLLYLKIKGKGSPTLFILYQLQLFNLTAIYEIIVK